MRRVFNHLGGGVPEQVRLRRATFSASPSAARIAIGRSGRSGRPGQHHATYKQIFLDAKHNQNGC